MSVHFAELAHAVRGELAQRHRYAHCVRVARLAASLARAHGLDPERAAVAAILHDLARLYTSERLIAECTARGMSIDAFERAHPVVLHARLGAELARERFGITDEEVLSAIRTHTVGAPNLTKFEAVLYLADSLEPDRGFPERAAYLRVAYADLDEALRLVLASGVAYLRARGLEPAPATIAAIEWYAAQEAGASTGKEGPMEGRLCRT